jgi:hypothetical protein
LYKNVSVEVKTTVLNQLLEPHDVRAMRDMEERSAKDFARCIDDDWCD